MTFPLTFTVLRAILSAYQSMTGYENSPLRYAGSNDILTVPVLPGFTTLKEGSPFMQRQPVVISHMTTSEGVSLRKVNSLTAFPSFSYMVPKSHPSSNVRLWAYRAVCPVIRQNRQHSLKVSLSIRISKYICLPYGNRPHGQER